jgi:hypothetical protein
MTPAQYTRFSGIRARMRDYIDSLLRNNAWILPVQRKLYRARGYREEELETPIVYNLALDEITEESSPRFIIVADNPGLQEQKTKNHRYLVGQAGKLAVSWFRANLDMDFRSATIIVNKTPVHTPKTAELRLLIKLADERGTELAALLSESQRVMARYACELAECLQCPLWVSGIGELRPRGIFSPWTEELRAHCAGAPASVRGQILLFRHFSMNQFAIEYAKARNDTKRGAPLTPSATLSLLEQIGRKNRVAILGI